MNEFLKELPQYHFDRDEFVKAFHSVFTSDEIIDIECDCEAGHQTDDFILSRYDGEYYIIHKDSGTMINWYKHLGRTNTCNKSGFTIDDLKEFLQLLKFDLQ